MFPDTDDINLIATRQVETLNKKLAELTDKELKQVTGRGIIVKDWNYVDIEIT